MTRRRSRSGIGPSTPEVRQAEHRMKARVETAVRAISARFDRRASRVIVRLNTGVEIAVPTKLAEGLAGARPSDLAQIEISPSGLGLHWPRLDADLYVPALLAGLLGSRRWMATALGEAGGRSTSPAKRAAARENGKLGGRPRRASV